MSRHCLLPASAGSAVLQILPQRRGDAASKTNAPRQRTRAPLHHSKNHVPHLRATSQKQQTIPRPPIKQNARTILTSTLRISDPNYHDHKAADQSRKDTIVMYGIVNSDAWSKHPSLNMVPITIGGANEYPPRTDCRAGQKRTTVMGARGG